MYYDKVNKELKEYFLILCDNDYPEFIEKYLNTKPLKKIGGIGQFCGCDYSKIFNVKYFYSRLDHSIACSLMAWHFTKDKAKTLMSLFHDLGTPCFSHTIDYLFGDSKKQESSEKDVFDIISSSNEIMNLLEKDDITIDDLKDAYKCGVVENERPKICVDRLDGVLGTALVWIGFWDINDVKHIYKDLEVLIDEQGKEEIGFNNIDSANYFFEAAYKYSIVLQGCEDKYVMQFICDALKVLVENNIITSVDINIIAHFGNCVCLEIACENVWPVSGYVNTKNIGTMLQAFVKLFDLEEEDGVRISKIKNVPCRLIFENGYNKSSWGLKCIGFGNFMKDKFILTKDFVKINNEDEEG